MTSPVDYWHTLLTNEAAGLMCARLTDRMRERGLRFGGRVICPFLRPFFLDAADEPRVTRVAETLWRLGERVTEAAMESPEILRQLALSEDEIRLARIDPGYATTSTAARADAFILPDSLQFAEYNGESPAGAGYSQGLADLFSEEPMMARFRRRFDVRMYRPVEALLEALVASYREWGGTASPPQVAIVDWRDVPTFSEFEILRDAFTTLGVPTIVCDPRDLIFEPAGAGPRFRGAGLYTHGQRIDLVYRRVLINDMLAREGECRVLLDAYEAGAVCVANSLRCKIPHKKAFFAVLTDQRRAGLFSAEEREIIRQHIPWTAIVEDGHVVRDGKTIDLLAHLRAHRSQFVIKPNDEYGGIGVTLGWETSEAAWDAALTRALAQRNRGWVAQQRIAIRREVFPVCEAAGLAMRDMLVDFAPYIFRGRLAGFLTRLSATGLANVTSGGGQVPAFVVSGK
jgi:circularly permuted ATPgrasp domain protein